MSNSYQGPKVSVTQQFVTSPGAVAIETLPPAAVGTAYNVYDKSTVGTAYGLVDRTIEWLDDKPVYSTAVAGKKIYEAYPPVVYAVAPKIGNVDLELATTDFAEGGISLSKDERFELPGSAQVDGVCEAILPFYKLTSTTVTIPVGNTSIINVTNGALLTARVQTKQKVWITTDGNTWLRAGTLSSVSSETQLILDAPYGSEVAGGVGIIIGSADATNAALRDYGENLYDPNGDFEITSKVQVGDLVELVCSAIPGTSPLIASVVKVLSGKLLQLNTTVQATGYVDQSFTKYYPQTNTGFGVASTLKIQSYTIKRLAGFSQNYMLKLLNSTGSGYSGVPVSKVNMSTFTYQMLAGADTVPKLNANDIFTLTAANPAASDEERSGSGYSFYRVDTITTGASGYTVTIDGNIGVSGYSGYFLSAWRPVTEMPLVADYRSIRTEEHNVVKRITSSDDIVAAWGAIHPRNDLAFMVQAMFSGAGGRNVCYGINVDSSGTLITEYENALEELKMFDVYSHAFGTTDGGVNAIIGSYCDAQSDPDEGHERIGIVTYDPDDLYTLGSGTGTINISNGNITAIAGFNTLTSGIAVNDEVEISTAAGVYVATAKVTATPAVATTLVTDYRGVSVSTPQLVFKFGRKDAKALAVGAIAYGNRRVAALFPGWFNADGGDGIVASYPPYYISATIAGMDGGVIASQSFTNKPFSIPGLSRISLGTNTYFKRTQLDEIGGGGIDIIIQDVNPSASIKSRHDLTTDMSAVQYRERSITKQADVAAKTLRNAVAPYVGRYNVNDPNLFKFLGQVCSIVTSKLVKSGVVARMNVDSITRDPVIDDKINFAVSLTAFIAGNYYDITLLIKTR